MDVNSALFDRRGSGCMDDVSEVCCWCEEVCLVDGMPQRLYWVGFMIHVEGTGDKDGIGVCRALFKIAGLVLHKLRMVRPL